MAHSPPFLLAGAEFCKQAPSKSVRRPTNHVVMARGPYRAPRVSGRVCRARGRPWARTDRRGTPSVRSLARRKGEATTPSLQKARRMDEGGNKGRLPPAQRRRLQRISGQMNVVSPAAFTSPTRRRENGGRAGVDPCGAAATLAADDEYVLSSEHAYQFDVNGFFVLRGHYNAADVAEFHRGIDELQAIPVTHAEYTKRGVAHPALHAAQADPDHDVWQLHDDSAPPPFRVDHAICGTSRFDRIVRDPVLRRIHETLAGGAVMLSATYYIEKHGPGAPGGGLHFGGFPRQRNFHYDFDHTNGRFNCFSTKATICLSDMSSVEHGNQVCMQIALGLVETLI